MKIEKFNTEGITVDYTNPAILGLVIEQTIEFTTHDNEVMYDNVEKELFYYVDKRFIDDLYMQLLECSSEIHNWRPNMSKNILKFLQERTYPPTPLKKYAK